MTDAGAPHPAGLSDPDHGLRLRAWRDEDAGALAAAWAVPDVRGASRAPADRSTAAAARWIAGAGTRAASGLAVDLAVSPLDGDDLWGEVGVVRRRLRAPAEHGGPTREQVVWEVGWWVLPERRGRGVATAAVRLLGTWAGPALGIGAWVARIAPDHGASQRVAAAAGLTRRGRFDAEHELWAGPLPPPPGRPSDRV